MNRILCFLGSRDPQQLALKLHRRAFALAERLERITENVVECYVPSSTEIVDNGHSEQTLKLKFYLNVTVNDVPMVNAATDLAFELDSVRQQIEKAVAMLTANAEGGDV